jgi:hypothetical protein
MGAAIGPRKDFSAEALRAMARRTKDGPRARRLLALAAIYDGATRGEAAKIGGVTLQIVRDWVLRFNADGPNGLVDRKAPGQPSLLKDEHRAALARMVEDGPTPAIHGVVRWRIVDRAVAPRMMARSTSSKKFPARFEEIAREKGVDARDMEIWFADEARVGQKNKLAKRWAKRGSRPSAPKDQRTASTYIFGAISPKDGKGAALVPPKCDTYAMNRHLAEIAKNVAPGAHAVLLIDQAGWHMTDKLDLPANITMRWAFNPSARLA